MTVRSDRLAGPIARTGAGGPFLFTVPLGETWLVKRITTQNLSGPLAGVGLWGVTVAGVTALSYSVSVSPGRADDHETWWALDPGAQLGFDAPLLTTFVVAAYGAKLLGSA